MGRRIYLALRLGAAFTMWLSYAFLLARIGIFAQPTEKSYSWRELRKWALNPEPLSYDQKLNLRYSLPIGLIPLSGVLVRLLTTRLSLLVASGAATLAISMLLVDYYVRKNGPEAILTEYGFGSLGVQPLHAFLYIPYFAFVVFLTGVLMRLI